MEGSRYLYVTPKFESYAEFSDRSLSQLTERHPFKSPSLSLMTLKSKTHISPSSEFLGVVIEAHNGWPYPAHLRLAKRWTQSGKQAFFFWPGESAIEVADKARFRSYWTLCFCVWLWDRVLPLARVFRRKSLHNDVSYPLPSSDISMTSILDTLTFQPLPLEPVQLEGHWKIKGRGVYLRTDYWSKISSGGSYGHTCYVAEALSNISDDLVCFMPHRYALLDDMGLKQMVFNPPFHECHEAALLQANDYFYHALKTQFETLRPAYIYERLVLGNGVGARLSQALKIPYLVEYNGSEISMNKSFGSGDYVHESEFLRIEAAAFTQATVISVISKQVKTALVNRGVLESKILVNPNAVNTQVYAPATRDEKKTIRESLGFSDSDCVIGFIGTFGGWHGIDVLAEALPLICKDAAHARFLLIGDGYKKVLVDDAIREHRLWGRVVCTGSVAQTEGARLLKACDVLVAPHSAHMVDSPFFGSPTKLFEYMGLGVGIVASDLEQMGEVLSPALRLPHLTKKAPEIRGERAILCAPGHVDEFVSAVLYLCSHPELSNILGSNARKAAEKEYTWSIHIQTLLAFVAKDKVTESSHRLQTHDMYKDEVQHQWDNNPCGSHYVKDAKPHTLEWFLEVERYRYQEYAPWMPDTMEFSKHAGHRLLEVGAGMGTDLAQFAKHGAIVTDVDLSSGHLALAQENFRLRGLQGTFIHHDAETLPFDTHTFDVVYSNGVIHHSPNTQRIIDEIYRVLKPGGKAIVMVYAEYSLHYWLRLVGEQGLRKQAMYHRSIGDIMSETVELTENGARPLVKVYSKRRLQKMFHSFADVSIVKRQITPSEIPRALSFLSTDTVGKMMGWNLIIKAYKPHAS